MSNSTIQPTASEVELEDKVKPAFYAVAFVLGLLGNFLVIIIVVARRNRRTANDIFILNLAISDLVYLFVCLPTNVYMMFADIQYDLYCRLIWPLMTVTVNLSIFTLTSMAVFRCYVILYPFKAEMRHRYVLLLDRGNLVSWTPSCAPVTTRDKTEAGGATRVYRGLAFPPVQAGLHSQPFRTSVHAATDHYCCCICSYRPRSGASR